MVCLYILLSSLTSWKGSGTGFEWCLQFTRPKTPTFLFFLYRLHIYYKHCSCTLFSFFLSHANCVWTVGYIWPCLKNHWVQYHQFVKQHKLLMIYFFYRFPSNYILRNNSGFEIPEENLVATWRSINIILSKNRMYFSGVVHYIWQANRHL